MYRVVIDPQRRWRWDDDRAEYVDVPAERGDEEKAWYAAAAEALARTTALQFPPRCPHCDRVTTTTRTLSVVRESSSGFFGRRGDGLLAIATVPSCERMPRPLPAYFGQLALSFLTVASTLAILATPYAVVVAFASALASVMLWRKRSAIFFESARDGELVFRVRDGAYAHGLAQLNQGRIEGRRQPPALAAGDAHRAPLPGARLQR